MHKNIIDANVMLLAGTSIRDIPQDQLECFEKSIDFIRQYMKSKSKVVLDDDYRILGEYQNAFHLAKSPNNATVFFRWVLSNSEYFPLQEEPENVFIPYPDDCELQNFDPPDRKYIALSYAHPDKPAIVEATDSKWWGIKQNLGRHGIIVYFIDEEYIESKFHKKME